MFSLRLLRLSFSRAQALQHMPRALSSQVETSSKAKQAVIASKPSEFAALASQCQSIDSLSDVISAFKESEPRSGHVAFINSALSTIERLEASPELTTYEALFSVFPSDNSFKTKSLLDAVWPRETPQTEVAMKMLEKIEAEGLIPEQSTHDVLYEKFGRASAPVKKVKSMGYWMRRFFNLNPFALPQIPIEDKMTWLKLSLSRIAGRAADVQEFKFPHTDSEETGCFSLSQAQQKTLSALPPKTPLTVCGLYRTYVSGRQQRYMYLSARTGAKEHILSLCVLEPPLHQFVPCREDGMEASELHTAVVPVATSSDQLFDLYTWTSAVHPWMKQLDATCNGQISSRSVYIDVTVSDPRQ